MKLFGYALDKTGAAIPGASVEIKDKIYAGRKTLRRLYPKSR